MDFIARQPTAAGRMHSPCDPMTGEAMRKEEIAGNKPFRAVYARVSGTGLDRFRAGRKASGQVRDGTGARIPRAVRQGEQARPMIPSSLKSGPEYTSRAALDQRPCRWKTAPRRIVFDTLAGGKHLFVIRAKPRTRLIALDEDVCRHGSRMEVRTCSLLGDWRGKFS